MTRIEQLDAVELQLELAQRLACDLRERLIADSTPLLPGTVEHAARVAAAVELLRSQGWSCTPPAGGPA